MTSAPPAHQLGGGARVVVAGRVRAGARPRRAPGPAAASDSASWLAHGHQRNDTGGSSRPSGCSSSGSAGSQPATSSVGRGGPSGLTSARPAWHPAAGRRRNPALVPWRRTAAARPTRPPPAPARPGAPAAPSGASGRAGTCGSGDGRPEISSTVMPRARPSASATRSDGSDSPDSTAETACRDTPPCRPAAAGRTRGPAGPAGAAGPSRPAGLLAGHAPGRSRSCRLVRSSRHRGGGPAAPSGPNTGAVDRGDRQLAAAGHGPLGQPGGHDAAGGTESASQPAPAGRQPVSGPAAPGRGPGRRRRSAGRGGSRRCPAGPGHRPSPATGTPGPAAATGTKPR